MLKKLLHIILTLTVLTTFSTTKTQAEDYSLIVIAGDQSSSMFDSNHIAIVREAMITALTNYVVDCNNIHVDYIAWGDRDVPPVSAELTDMNAINEYAVAFYPVSFTRLLWTSHFKGVNAAVERFSATSAKKKVLIFITDGVSKESADWDLGRTIQSDVKVFTISLGTKSVSDFVEKNIMPKSGGVHFHADNADELKVSIEQAFAAAKTEMCLS